jgi:FKBP-type peptidyl-prolyl cis-trans isomerase FklB
MKLQTLTFLTIAMCAAVASAQNPPANPPPPNAPPPAPKTDFTKIFKNDTEKDSYAIGMSWGMGIKGRLKAQDIEFDAEALLKGLKDSIGDGPAMVTEAQMKEILGEFSNELRTKADAKHKQEAADNKSKGEAFLEKNKTMTGVVALPSGLQYKIITEGSGASPTAQDEVTVNYRGTFLDGKEFDSSYKHNQPLVTRVQGGIIKGWTEALELMKPGAKWEIYVPSDLAYGEPGRQPTIGPNSTLIFEIELLSVKPASSLPPTSSAAPPGAPLTSDIIKVPSAEEMKKGAKIETIKAEDIEKEKAKATNNK